MIQRRLSLSLVHFRVGKDCIESHVYVQAMIRVWLHINDACNKRFNCDFSQVLMYGIEGLS